MRIIPKFISHAIDKCYTYILIKRSGMFDEDWYVKTYLQNKTTVKSPLAYYIKKGYKQGHAPSLKFSTSLYIKEHPEININPLVHYLKYGRKKGYVCYTYQDEEQLVKNWLENQKPLVSVIVPNYNHASYLRERLDSIYNQTYKNIEVILMDDKSSDNSIQILKEYRDRYSAITTLIANEQNSGSPFSQWEKGILMANGDYVWIAESDDWCDTNFLETLLPIFIDEAVMLAFARTDFMTNGKVSWTIEKYLKEIGCGVFEESFVATSHTCVKKYFSKKNIIPNVSSCIFRCPTNPVIFKDEKWKQMKICGDWIFYLHLIRGGYIGYSTKTTNYYRQHPHNTSVNLQKQDIYYQEHQIVREHLAKLYDLSFEELDWIVNDLKSFWKHTRMDFSEEQFKAIFNPNTIYELKKTRIPNITICSYAFSTGGGEKIPIEQANALHESGVCVTFIDCEGSVRNEKIRSNLHRDIPLISLGWDFSNIESLLRDIGTEVIHTHHASVDYAIATTKPDNVKQVVTLHGMYETIPPKYLKIQMPILAKKVHNWLYIAEKNRKTMIQYGILPDRLTKIYNAITPQTNIKNRDCIIKECQLPHDSFIIALASRALPEKGWRYAYDAVKKVRNRTKKDIYIIFIGDGDEYETMRMSCEEWAIFIGYSNDVSSYFNAADVVMLPSVYSGESFPLCILEAFSVNTPVIATGIGEIPTMMTTQVGIAGLVIDIKQNGKIELSDLESAIMVMLEKGDEYKKAIVATKEANKKYSIEKLVNILISLYKDDVIH